MQIIELGDQTLREYAQCMHRFTTLQAEARLLATQGKEALRKVADLTTDELVLAETAKLLQSFSEEEQEAVQRKIEGMVTYGLHLIFGNEFKEFRLNSGVERGQVFMNPTVVFTASGVDVTSDIMSSHGGGPSDVIGFILKLLIILFKSKAKVRPVLFLDESFAHLSEEYLPLMGQLIRKFCDVEGVQVCLVTHQSEFLDHADMAYRFTKQGSVTKVQKL